MSEVLQDLTSVVESGPGIHVIRGGGGQRSWNNIRFIEA